MENKLRGTVTLDVHGEALTFCYTWDALIQYHEAWGDKSINLQDPATLLQFAILGLHAHHPGLTIDKLKAMQPPLLPLLKTAQRAHTLAYVGYDDGEDADPRKPGALSRLQRFFNLRSGQESDQTNSLH